MDGIDAILAYGCKAMIVSLLEDELERAINNDNAQPYVDMCLSIMRFIRKGEN